MWNKPGLNSQAKTRIFKEFIHRHKKVINSEGPQIVFLPPFEFKLDSLS